ncbi:MAG: hypothetical protein KME21_28630 [Desmonostoc vinosum HA7617-LM4]|nr:hypothetical protein [Desmonostoc vinosum HA7617-LM4]
MGSNFGSGCDNTCGNECTEDHKLRGGNSGSDCDNTYGNDCNEDNSPCGSIWGNGCNDDSNVCDGNICVEDMICNDDSIVYGICDNADIFCVLTFRYQQLRLPEPMNIL